MENGKKAAIGATIVAVLAVGVRVGLIYRERNAPAVVKPAEKEKTPQDYLVFLKKKRPSNLAELKELVGTTVWVSAGGQIEYYPVVGGKAQYGKGAGTLLGAEEMKVTGAVEQVAPKEATFRIPGGDRQVLLEFTLPKSGGPETVYAAPVGYREAGQYTFYTDEILFYDDPHELYKHWGPEVWKAIDEHRVILGMSELEVQLALGQVSKSNSTAAGNRMVVYSNVGKPMAVTFEKDKVTSFRADQGY